MNTTEYRDLPLNLLTESTATRAASSRIVPSGRSLRCSEVQCSKQETGDFRASHSLKRDITQPIVPPGWSANRKFEPRLRIAPCVREATHLYEMTHFPDTRKALPCKLLPFCTLTFLLGSIP
jgi:hypothetical protein